MDRWLTVEGLELKDRKYEAFMYVCVYLDLAFTHFKRLRVAGRMELRERVRKLEGRVDEP